MQHATGFSCYRIGSPNNRSPTKFMFKSRDTAKSFFSNYYNFVMNSTTVCLHSLQTISPTGTYGRYIIPAHQNAGKTNCSLLTKKKIPSAQALNYGVSLLFSIIKKNVIDFSENVEVCSMRTMQLPTSTPLGLQDSEHGEALAKIQGSLQASQIPRASPAPGRNPPQVDSTKFRKTKC